MKELINSYPSADFLALGTDRLDLQFPCPHCQSFLILPYLLTFETAVTARSHKKKDVTKHGFFPVQSYLFLWNL